MIIGRRTALTLSALGLVIVVGVGCEEEGAASATRLLAPGVIVDPGAITQTPVEVSRISLLGGGAFAGLAVDSRQVGRYDVTGAKTDDLGEISEAAAAQPSSFAVAPDGESYLWIDGEGLHQGLFADGAATLLDPFPSQGNAQPARFNAGGDTIVYFANIGPGARTMRRLQLGGTVEILREFVSDTARADIASDGTVYASGVIGTEIATYAPGTTTQGSIPIPVADAIADQIEAHEPVLSLDEKRLVFWSERSPEPTGGFSFLFTIAVDGTGLTLIGGTSAANSEGRLAGSYTPSADGLTAFATFDSNAEGGAVGLEKIVDKTVTLLPGMPALAYVTLQ